MKTLILASAIALAGCQASTAERIDPPVDRPFLIGAGGDIESLTYIPGPVPLDVSPNHGGYTVCDLARNCTIYGPAPRHWDDPRTATLGHELVHVLGARH